MASQGRSPLGGLVLGSEATQVLHLITRPDPLLDARRADVIALRVALIALAFSALTAMWAPIDVALFPESRWYRLAIARAIAAIALVVVGMGSYRGARSLAKARAGLLALFIIPALFFAATVSILDSEPLHGVAAGIAAAYSFVPIVMAAGISIFPLTVAEVLVLAGIAVAAEAAAFVQGGRPLVTYDAVHGQWLLLLIAGVSMVASRGQLHMLRDLVAQAARDPLTRCLRRDSGREMLEQLFRLAVRQKMPLTLLFADIDRFKAVNDRHGHEAGDRILEGVASRLRAALRASDVLVRWGGEEFVMLLPQSDARSAEALMERLRSQGFGLTPSHEAITVSIGIASYPADGAGSADELVALADRRMYAAKDAGRDAYVGCDEVARGLLRAKPQAGAQAVTT